MQDITTFITNHPLLCIATLIIVILASTVEFIRATRNTFNISAQAATQKINHDNALVLDLRPNDLYRKGHIIHAISQTADDIRTDSKKLEKYKAQPIILVCNTGLESQKVAALLLKQGYNAYALQGGMRGWLSAAMPLVKE